ncbi:S1/P1 nuclease-domain-containing protein [Entophlyctis helioformis]|nr:S1/P1 nuclease-domain-containing protein [Entophlyctis helioformis]
MFAPIAALALAAASAPAVSAWGGVGHWTVGYVAMNFLDDNAKAVVADLLKPTETLAYVSVWADIVRNTAAFSFTSGYHFVNPVDSPPAKCDYDDDRDCKTSACIVGAIGNYTARATCNNGLPKQDRYEALKFLVHFIGDIAQPLHACGRERGGNDRVITFDGNSNVKLHAIWDTNIPEKYLKAQGLFVSGNDGASAKNYADHLMAKINGEYKDKLAGWLSNKGVYAVNQNRNSLAAIDWATDSNDFNCNTVWPAVDKDTTQDFGGKYYTDAAPVVNIQIAKAGYRLGNWINRVFARCASAPSSTTTVAPVVAPTTTTVAPVVIDATTTVDPLLDHDHCRACCDRRHYHRRPCWSHDHCRACCDRRHYHCRSRCCSHHDRRACCDRRHYHCRSRRWSHDHCRACCDRRHYHCRPVLEPRPLSRLL